MVKTTFNTYCRHCHTWVTRNNHTCPYAEATGSKPKAVVKPKARPKAKPKPKPKHLW